MTTDTIELDSDDSTRNELRQKIAVMVGCRNEGEVLSKSTLNSVYAYFTGDFYFPPRVRHRPHEPEFEERDDVFVAVAEAAGIAERPNDDSNSDGDDDDSDDDDESDAWTTENGEQPQEFRRDELRTIAEKIDSSDDERDWIHQ